MTLPTTEPIPIESGVMATTAPPAASKRRGRPPKTSKVPATAETTEHQEEEVLDEGHAPAAPSPALGSLEEQDEQQAEQQPEQQLHLDSAALLVEESGDSAAAWLQTSATQTLDLAAHSVLCYELLGGEGVERVPEETDSAMCARLWAEWEESMYFLLL